MNIDQPKRCVVMHKPTQRLMAYDEETNSLYFAPDFSYHIFPAKMRARSATNVTIELEKQKGKERPQDDYETIEV